jgi:hypothetical protein
MFPLNIGDEFRIPQSQYPDAKLTIQSIELDDYGEVAGFKGFTPLMLPFNFSVYRDKAGSFRVEGTEHPISFIP